MVPVPDPIQITITIEFLRLRPLKTAVPITTIIGNMQPTAILQDPPPLPFPMRPWICHRDLINTADR